MTGIDTLPKTFQLSVFRMRKAAAHSHSQSLEILFPLKGRISVFTNLETQVLETGDVLIIDSGTIHSVQAENAAVCSLCINLDAYRDRFPYIRCVSFERLIRKETDDMLEMYIRNILLRQVILHSMKTTSATGAAGDLTVLLLTILPNKMVEFLNPEYTSQTEEAFRRVLNISAYLSDHYAERITAAKLAKIEGISVTRLSHFWKDASTLSISDTLTVIRLGYSVADVVFGTQRIEDIALSHGFNNAKYFYRCFAERYGMTPREYQKQIFALHEQEEEFSGLSYRQVKECITAYAIPHYHLEVDTTALPIPDDMLVRERSMHHLYSTLLSKNTLLVEQGRQYNQQSGYLILSPAKTILPDNQLNWEYIYAAVNFYLWGEFDVVIQVEFDTLETDAWEKVVITLLQEAVFLWERQILRHIRIKIQTIHLDLYDTAGLLGQKIQQRYPEVRVENILLI